MVLCGLCNIFRKNKTHEFKKMLEESQSRNNDIILDELNLKVTNAEAEYTKNPSAENMLHCIGAVNMKNKYLQNIHKNKNNNKHTKTILNKIEENTDEDLC